MSVISAVMNIELPVKQMLREDLPEQFARLMEAISEGKLAKAANIAHSIRGSAAFCQLEELRVAALNTERELKQNQENLQTTNELEKQVMRVLHALEHEDQNT